MGRFLFEDDLLRSDNHAKRGLYDRNMTEARNLARERETTTLQALLP